MSLVLASTSPARAAILRNAGLAFDVRPSGVDEAPIKLAALARGDSPRRIAEILAEAKAVAASRGSPDLTLGADQTLEFDGVLFDKADTIGQARDTFYRLRGRRHQLHSAAALAQNGQLVWHAVETAALTLRDFSDAVLEDYLSRNADVALSCVGGYALEGEAIQLFSSIEGDYFTVLGLPIFALLVALRRLKVTPT